MPRYAILNAFAAGPLLGNPAAVVLDDPARDDGWRQGLAADFNLSETAFVRPLEGGRWGLRWFTPRVEVDLCGHATLATTQALGAWGLAAPGAWLAFETRSGELRCRLEPDGVAMDFPALAVEPVAAPPGLWDALKLDAGCPVFRDREDYLVLAPGTENVRGLRPDFQILAQVPCRGVCVTAPAAAGMDADFVSRFFGPRVGIDEDPVTGSAHCRLGPFWRDRLGKDRLRGLQLSSRGGRVGVDLLGQGRLLLRGRAVLEREGDC